MCCPPYDGDTSARSDHNQEDDVDDQHLDNLFLLPQGLATCGGLLLTKVFTSYIAGPVNAVRFLFFCTIVLCLYTAAAITTGNPIFAECLRLCRVPKFEHSAKESFTECKQLNTRQNKDTRQTLLLPSAVI